MANHIKNPNQLLDGICAIMYKQQIKPKVGIKDKLYWNDQMASKTVTTTNSNIGIWCMPSLNCSQFVVASGKKYRHKTAALNTMIGNINLPLT